MQGPAFLTSPTRFQTLEYICVNLRLMSSIRVHSRLNSRAFAVPLEFRIPRRTGKRNHIPDIGYAG
jgi:hypothetical protein